MAEVASCLFFFLSYNAAAQLEQYVLRKQIELVEIFKGIMPYLGIVIFCMFLMYMFPGIALWFPDYLFGPYIP